MTRDGPDHCGQIGGSGPSAGCVGDELGDMLILKSRRDARRLRASLCASRVRSHSIGRAPEQVADSQCTIVDIYVENINRCAPHHESADNVRWLRFAATRRDRSIDLYSYYLTAVPAQVRLFFYKIHVGRGQLDEQGTSMGFVSWT